MRLTKAIRHRVARHGPACIHFSAMGHETGRILSALYEKSKAGRIAPIRCTCEPAFAMFEQTLGDHYRYAGLGITPSLDPRAAAMGEIGQAWRH